MQTEEWLMVIVLSRFWQPRSRIYKIDDCSNMEYVEG